MRFTLLVPGTGSFFCGSCLRDDALGKALRGLGHEVTVVPLYLPLVLEDGGAEAPVRMGGVNMYLQQHSRLAGRLPRFVTRLLDRPGLLRFAARRASLTDAAALGAMTVSMLEGERGRQARELDELCGALAAEPRPDVVVLSNALLVGAARRLRQALDRPVVVTLQGEAPFLDGLVEPWRTRAWRELAARAADVERFVAVSRYTHDLMRERLSLPEQRLAVVHNGIDLRGFPTEPVPLAARTPPAIGYLARLCRDKGLDTLCRAFVRLRERGRVAGVRLIAAGAETATDRAFVRSLLAELGSHRAHVEVRPNVSRADKIALLERCSVLSVPATYGESFGLYLLEAWASGVPVVQPRHGAFPELLASTGGGVLCEPDDPDSLSIALEKLLLDPARAQELATRGHGAVTTRFRADDMARGFVAACSNQASGSRRPPRRW